LDGAGPTGCVQILVIDEGVDVGRIVGLTLLLGLVFVGRIEGAKVVSIVGFVDGSSVGNLEGHKDGREVGINEGF